MIERRQGLKNRWNEHCLQFKDALREFEDKKKLSLLVKARSDAMERIFHIALKRKYSGQLEFGNNFFWVPLLCCGCQPVSSFEYLLQIDHN